MLIEEDRLYFTAGMWSRDGVFIYCLKPSDGSAIWKNDTSGFHFATLPHSTGFAGVAPQGYLSYHRGRLYVPTGRGAPACFYGTTGKLNFYENGWGYKPHQPGGSRVMAWRDWVIFQRRSQKPIEGDARGICIAGNSFVISSTAGKLYCFGAGLKDAGRVIVAPTKVQAIDPSIKQLAATILRVSNIRSGYALVLGAGDGQLLHELATQSKLVIYCLESDAAKVARVRKMLDDSGLYGVRVAVHQGDPRELPYNRYFADLVVCERPRATQTLQMKNRQPLTIQ